MKKIISIFILCVLIFLSVKANQSVIVSAVVWTDNHSPVILSVNPNSNPRILATNKTQSYTIYFRDDEKDQITYTITPDNWFANPISGTILSSNYDTASWAYINFLYLSPATSNISSNPNEKIIVTINDGVTVVKKELNLYIY